MRTELPFYLSVENNHENLERKQWAPNGDLVVSEIETIISTFSGRADLVLALRDEHSQGWLQVVDAKTKQCLYGFNPTNPIEGNALQISSSQDSPFASTPSEEELISEHRLQLTLYSIALEKNELSKPEKDRRKVLPPAIQISASGRMIRMRDEDYELAKEDLHSLLKWSGEIAASNDPSLVPDRLPVSMSDTCKKCPFYTGGIKLCGPIGEKLGPA